MTPDDFRQIALANPPTVESSHLNQPNFRLDGRINASMGSPDFDSALVKLTPEQQLPLVERGDGVYRPASGNWGRSGYTVIRLSCVAIDEMREVLEKSAQNAQPRPRQIAA